MSRNFQSDPRWIEQPAHSLLQIGENAFEEQTRGSPLRRAEREGLARNAAIVLANANEQTAIGMLDRAARNDPCEIVRETAQWALQELKRKGQR